MLYHSSITRFDLRCFKTYKPVCAHLCRVPFLMMGGLLISGERTDTIDSAFFYGRAQVRKTPAENLHYILFFTLLFSYIVFCSSLLNSVYFQFYSVKEIFTFTYK